MLSGNGVLVFRRIMLALMTLMAFASAGAWWGSRGVEYRMHWSRGPLVLPTYFLQWMFEVKCSRGGISFLLS